MESRVESPVVTGLSFMVGLGGVVIEAVKLIQVGAAEGMEAEDLLVGCGMAAIGAQTGLGGGDWGGRGERVGRADGDRGMVRSGIGGHGGGS